jgi:hypothetical protein
MVQSHHEIHGSYVIKHASREIPRDLSGYTSLISRHCWYFGAEAPRLLDRFWPLVKRGMGHRIAKDERIIASFVKWLEGFGKPGRYGMPWGMRESCGGHRAKRC